MISQNPVKCSICLKSDQTSTLNALVLSEKYAVKTMHTKYSLSMRKSYYSYRYKYSYRLTTGGTHHRDKRVLHVHH
jgi:hypothetical protein